MIERNCRRRIQSRHWNGLSISPLRSRIDRSGLAGHLRGMATSRRHSTKLAGRTEAAHGRCLSERAQSRTGYGRAAASSDERHPLIPVTNAYVNPARSTGPALFAGSSYIGQLWLFWLAPCLGAALAGFVGRWQHGLVDTPST